MKWILVAVLGLASCGQIETSTHAPENEVKQSKASVPNPTLDRDASFDDRLGRVVKREEGEFKVNLIEYARSESLSIDHFIHCGVGASLDGGSHTWVYCFGRDGKASHALLFRRSDHDQDLRHPNPRPRAEHEKFRLEVFLETIRDGTRIRRQLTPEGAAQEVGRLERYVKAFVGVRYYNSYYRGGKPHDPRDWEEVCEPSRIFDPLPAKAQTELSELERERRLKLKVISDNHFRAWEIAALIRAYRAHQQNLGMERGLESAPIRKASMPGFWGRLKPALRQAP